MALKDNLRKRTTSDLREERDQLGGWIRQPEARWLDPSILAKAGVEVAVSGTFGKFADKREIQAQPQGPFDYSAEGELWSTTCPTPATAGPRRRRWRGCSRSRACRSASTTCSAAGCCCSAAITSIRAPRRRPYEDRFMGPFAAAWPHSPEGHEPDMYATPGNRDWYDGLLSFL